MSQPAISVDERELSYAYIRDEAVDGLIRTVFIRLQPATEDEAQYPAGTLFADSAHVDVDADGRVIGVTVMLPEIR